MTDLSYPDGKRFAFTILDDTDDFQLATDRPIYDLLWELGFRTTKTVWVFDAPASERGQYALGDTLQDPAYASWVEDLSAQGFEIAFHGASMVSSRRERTRAAIAWLEERFPGALDVYCNHGENRENLRWGAHRYTWAPTALLGRVLHRVRNRPAMDGHIPTSEYFWADLARDHVRYARSLTFHRLNCRRIPPGRPFRDPRRPEVPTWFNTADASSARQFKELVTRDAVDRLEAEGGWAIVSTHLGKGFVRDGEVDPQVTEVLADLAARPGWFVPVGTLLDHLAIELGSGPIDPFDRAYSESLHVWDRAVGDS